MDNQEFLPIQPIGTTDQRPRVFISSTIKELKLERRTARAAVESVRLHPVMFEPGARPYSARDYYRALLEQSHIYIGIFWKSYGWVGKDMSVSGIEDEFNRSGGKLQLIYIKEADEGDRHPRLNALLSRIRDTAEVVYSSFSTCEELYEQISDDLIQLLSDRFLNPGQPTQNSLDPPDYLQQLRLRMEAVGIIDRQDLLRDMQGALATSGMIAVTGHPGSGKTYLLGQLGIAANAIYVSIRNKTAQQVCAYLASHLAIRAGRYPKRLVSEDEARLVLQEELQGGQSLLLIDDADQNPEVATALLSLDYYGCQVVFCIRSLQANPIAYEGLQHVEIPSFTAPQILQFLELYGVKLPPGELQRISTASRGNPLYLYYFTQFQLLPFPEGLEEYQAALWNRLSSTQRELLNLVAHSQLVPLGLADLHMLVNAKATVTTTPMETRQHLEGTNPILQQVDSRYYFFHPYFEEYVRNLAERDDVSVLYHHDLGEYATSKNWVVPAAYHLMKGNDVRMVEYLSTAAQISLLRGEWRLAQEFIEREISIAHVKRDLHSEAFAHYMLCQVFHEVGKHAEAITSAEMAVRLFNQNRDTEWSRLVRFWTGALLVNVGRTAEALIILQEAVEFYNGRGDIDEALAHLNLSYACIRLSLYSEGATAAQRALDLFTGLQHAEGVYSSLTNLSACVGGLGNREQQGEYAKRIIETALAHNLPMLRIAGLNHRGVAERVSGDAVAAQHTFEECIALCQQYGLVEKEAYNIANLGNALRDQGKLGPAEAAYMEVLTKAREHSLARQEAHALEMLAQLRFRAGRHEEALELGAEALKLHTQTGETIRIASTEEYLARSFLALGNMSEAANSYEQSAVHYEISGAHGEAAFHYGQAASIWNSLGEREAAFRCLRNCVTRVYVQDGSDAAEDMHAQSGLELMRVDAGDFYLQALKSFLHEEVTPDLRLFMYNFAAYCTRQESLGEKAYYRRGIDILVAHLDRAGQQPNVLASLAIGIEQASSDIFPVTDFDTLAISLSAAVEGLYYHHVHGDELRIWTFGIDWDETNRSVVKILCVSDDGISQRVAIALALILCGFRQEISQHVAELGVSKETDFTLCIWTQRDFEANTMLTLPPEGEGVLRYISVLEMESESSIVLRHDYEEATKWAEQPRNVAFVSVLSTAYGNLISHFTHLDLNGVEGQNIIRRCFEFVRAVLR